MPRPLSGPNSARPWRWERRRLRAAGAVQPCQCSRAMEAEDAGSGAHAGETGVEAWRRGGRGGARVSGDGGGVRCVGGLNGWLWVWLSSTTGPLALPVSGSDARGIDDGGRRLGAEQRTRQGSGETVGTLRQRTRHGRAGHDKGHANSPLADRAIWLRQARRFGRFFAGRSAPAAASEGPRSITHSTLLHAEQERLPGEGAPCRALTGRRRRAQQWRAGW